MSPRLQVPHLTATIMSCHATDICAIQNLFDLIQQKHIKFFPGRRKGHRKITQPRKGN